MHYLEQELRTLLKSDPSIFEFFQTGSLDGIWYWDLEKPDHEWLSPNFWTTLGYDPQDKKHLAAERQDLTDPEDLQVVLDNFNKPCADPKHPYDQVVRYKHKDGSILWMRCRGIAIRDNTGKPVRMLGAHNDLTRHNRVEALLKKERDLFDRIIETSPAGQFAELKISRSPADGGTGNLPSKVLGRF